MTRPRGFQPGFSLTTLEAQLNAMEIPLGGLVQLSNQDQKTIGVYDRNAPKGQITLRPGGPAAMAGEIVICTGTVFILNQLQQVTAYRT